MNRSRAWLLVVVAASGACGGERRVHPPPEGEWLEWEPKPEGEKERSAPAEASAEEPAPRKPRASEIEDRETAPPAKPSPSPGVKCNAKNVARESLCVELGELDAKECPPKLPKIAKAKEAGSLELPPLGARREPALEESAKQCCYAWCAKVPAARPAPKCDHPEPLFCFEAPAGGTSNAAPPPYAECPGGLDKTAAKGKRKAVPRATFSASETKAQRADHAKACCYDACR